MNIRKTVEAYTMTTGKSSPDKTKNIEELDEKLEKLLLTNENKSDTKKTE